METVSRFPPLQQSLNRVALLLLALSGTVSHAVDLGPWARHVRQHGEWTSLDFRHPATGLFIAARAGTEDRRTDTTLTVTAAPAMQCEPETVIVHKLESPAAEDVEKSIQLNLRTDGLPSRQVQARFVMPRGDYFAFVQLIGGLPREAWRDQGTLAADLPLAGTVVFSLNGFANAWAEAEKTCRAFLAR